MRIVMIGSGYVGLVSGACFADFGHHVTCVDKDANKIGRLRAGGIPIYEPGLYGLVTRNAAAGNRTFPPELFQDGGPAAVGFLAVSPPTPPPDDTPAMSHRAAT